MSECNSSSTSTESNTTTTTKKKNVIHVVVASTSAAKVAAVEEAFAAALGADVTVETRAVAVPSGVRAQPIGADETLRGACTRLRGAAACVPGADYYVAIEAGVAPPPTCTTLLRPHPASLSAIAFVAIARPSDDSSSAPLHVSVVPAPAFPLPRVLRDSIVEGGEELGPACAHVFAPDAEGHAGGAVGCLTRGGVSRAQLYVPAVRLALVPFLNTTFAYDLPTLVP